MFWLDLNYVFLRPDGTINTDRMPDLLHPSPKGALLWAKAMEATLFQLLGDRNRNTDPVVNRALAPRTKLEDDCYDWFARHDAVLKIKDQIKPEVVMIGDSITHFWGGRPETKGHQNSPKAWRQLFGDRPVLNLGFGWDRTQNVLWRLDHGEFDGLHPRYVVLNIGTNNFSSTENFAATTPAQTAEAIGAICIRIRSKAPESHIIIMGVFPRGQKADKPARGQYRRTEQAPFGVCRVAGITFLDISNQFLNSDGTIPQSLMGDFCHPTEQGYMIWANALKPYLNN